MLNQPISTEPEMSPLNRITVELGTQLMELNTTIINLEETLEPVLRPDNNTEGSDDAQESPEETDSPVVTLLGQRVKSLVYQIERLRTLRSRLDV